MKVSIHNIADEVKQIFKKWEFPEQDIEIILQNFIDAELYGKKSHGFENLFWYKDVVDGKYGPLNKNGPSPQIAKETTSSLTIDGKDKTGYVVMNYAINKALEKVKDVGLLSVALTNTAPTIGFIGSYAKRATKEGYIFICFSNAGKSTALFGTMTKIVGTNPVIFGIPTNEQPIILDMATAATTYASLLKSKATNSVFPENVGLNAVGNLTNKPEEILSGGMLIPFGGYKGSGISLMVEILAGALTGSKTGSNNNPHWGTTFILLDPTLFCEKEEFYKRITNLIQEIKNAQKRTGIKEVLLPGEKSQNTFEENRKKGEIEIPDDFFERLKKISS